MSTKGWPEKPSKAICKCFNRSSANNAASERFDELRDELGESERTSDEEILEGLLRIADERMAEAIRHISVRKGIDPAGYGLVAFGGAGWATGRIVIYALAGALVATVVEILTPLGLDNLTVPILTALFCSAVLA